MFPTYWPHADWGDKPPAAHQADPLPPLLLQVTLPHSVVAELELLQSCQLPGNVPSKLSENTVVVPPPPPPIVTVKEIVLPAEPMLEIESPPELPSEREGVGSVASLMVGRR
ncbi:MAG: hypothetical protein MUO25_14265, partial [Thermoanaerobaculaceae bacterium]|nr:hypothetical protein [Thermoanaerobaculaceae bacterium]